MISLNVNNFDQELAAGTKEQLGPSFLDLWQPSIRTPEALKVGGGVAMAKIDKFLKENLALVNRYFRHILSSN